MPPGFDHRSSNEGNVDGNCEESCEEVFCPQAGQEGDLCPQACEEDDGSQAGQADGFEEVSNSSSSKRSEPLGFGAFFYCHRALRPQFANVASIQARCGPSKTPCEY